MIPQVMKKCCGKKGIRHDLSQVWRSGDYLYATNGAILARCKAGPTHKGLEPNGNVPNVEAFVRPERPKWVRLPTDVPPAWFKCPVCEGTGGPVACRQCDGSGREKCFECGAKSKCESCGGKGHEAKCDQCNGERRIRNEDDSVIIGGERFRPWILEILTEAGVKSVHIEHPTELRSPSGASYARAKGIEFWFLLIADVFPKSRVWKGRVKATKARKAVAG